jgi:hypothetical protein
VSSVLDAFYTLLQHPSDHIMKFFSAAFVAVTLAITVQGARVEFYNVRLFKLLSTIRERLYTRPYSTRAAMALLRMTSRTSLATPALTRLAVCPLLETYTRV